MAHEIKNTNTLKIIFPLVSEDDDSTATRSISFDNPSEQRIAQSLQSALNSLDAWVHDSINGGQYFIQPSGWRDLDPSSEDQEPQTMIEKPAYIVPADEHVRAEWTTTTKYTYTPDTV